MLFEDYMGRHIYGLQLWELASSGDDTAQKFYVAIRKFSAW
jgi:hypothetical protein